MGRPKKLTAIEQYLVDMINKKYATRIFQKMNTEYERLNLERGSEPSAKEYEWMIKKALALHREINVSEEEEDEEETTDTV